MSSKPLVPSCAVCGNLMFSVGLFRPNFGGLVYVWGCRHCGIVGVETKGMDDRAPAQRLVDFLGAAMEGSAPDGPEGKRS